MNQIYYIIVLIATIWDVSWCYSKIGEPCAIGGMTGTCKRITDCPYAMRKVKQQEEKPEICFYDDKVVITCCPTNVTVPLPTVYKFLFDINHLIIKSDDMTCYYQHRKTILCCENDKPKRADPEWGCPMLPRPRLTNLDEKGEEILFQHPAWLKCVEYQRYFNVCITNPEGSLHKYGRQNTCGINKNSGRIFGGHLANDREFPHMAVIGRTDDTNVEDIEWTGGGTLLNEKFVLTAAHVLVNPGSKATYVLLGTNNKNDIKNGILYNIVRQIIHDEYNRYTNENDIALVELHQSVTFSEFIRPACLPVPNRQLTDDDMIIAGWGRTEKQKTSQELLCANVRESNKCLKTYGEHKYNSERMICAEGDNSIDTCQGDSGGPLMQRLSNLNCSYSIEGVVSHGVDCGKAGGVYTRVTYYLDWIMKYVWREEWNLYLETIHKKHNDKNDEITFVSE